MQTLEAMPSGALVTKEDEFEKFVAFLDPLAPDDGKVTHRFMRLYVRTIEMRKGTVWSSKVHKTRHPFEITKGRVAVFTSKDGWQRLQAPYSGVTEPGTKRFIVVEEDCIWSTFHETDKTDVLEIEKDIIEPHDNPLLTDEEKLRIVDASK